MEDHLKMFQEHLGEIEAKEKIRIRKLIAEAINPHSTADYETAAAAIEKELQE